MSANKSQISPIPPESYGDRFVKFIGGLTMTKEEQEREVQSGEQLDGSFGTPRQSSFPISRTSNENKVIEKAEKQAQKTEKEGSTEEPQRDKTLSTLRSTSAERLNGVGGTTLPVVEEDGEAGSREDSVQEVRADNALKDDERPPPTPEKDRLPNEKQLPSLPNFNRLSMGLQSTTPAASDR